MCLYLIVMEFTEKLGRAHTRSVLLSLSLTHTHSPRPALLLSKARQRQTRPPSTMRSHVLATSRIRRKGGARQVINLRLQSTRIEIHYPA